MWRALLRMIFVLVFLATANCFAATGHFALKRDLKSELKTYDDDHYVSPGKTEHTIYFEVDADLFAGDYLTISSPDDLTIFVNGVLAGMPGRYQIDSLSKIFRSPKLMVAVHGEKIHVEKLVTRIDSWVGVAATIAEEDNGKPETYFRDFVIVASLVLLVLLIVVMYLNPKLASDYLSVTKIFSLRESDDTQLYTRISNSSNILFYALASLMLGLFFMLSFHFSMVNSDVANGITTTGFWSTLSKWITISLIIFGVFFLKIILVYSLSYLFGSRNVAGIHFFNWVRFLLIVFGLSSIIVLIYFIMRGERQAFYFVFLKLMIWLLAGWIVLIFLKLNGRTGYTLFHLFSYICATEIIPLLIIISVLYN